MADVPEPTPVEGWARERRLGKFELDGLQEVLERQAEREAVQASVARQRALVAAVLLSLGILAVVAAVTAILSWSWGLLVFGMMCIIVSVMFGMDSSSTDDKRGS